jgi:predicted acylesterase/phospholipase RssA
MPSKTPTRFFQTCLGVFQGGGCRGAAFAGALEEAIVARGVDFAGVAGTSAGSIVAALMGAGATADYILNSLKALDFTKLLKEPEEIPNKPGFAARAGLGLTGLFLDAAKIIRYNGRYSSKGLEDWLNDRLKELLPITKGARVKFRDLPTPTYIVAADIISNDVKIWSYETTPDEEVALAARCSCSIPGFFQPVNGRYIDGGVLSNLPAFIFSGEDFSQAKPFANRILAFTLVAEHEDKTPETTKEFLRALVNTIIDGASKLQGRIVNSVHQIAINTGTIQATDFFEMNDQKIEWLVSEGQAAAKTFFDHELGHVQAAQQRTNMLSGEDEVYSILTEALDETYINQIVISDTQTRWAWKLYPALLAWRMRGATIQVILNSPDGASPSELYRRRLMRALGATLHITSSIPFRGFLLNPTNQALARAIVIAPDIHGRTEDAAVLYRAPYDFPAIQALWGDLKPLAETDANQLKVNLGLRGIADNDVLDKLKKYVPAYAGNAQLEVKPVSLKSMVLLTRLVRGYKYKQIQQMFEIFQSRKMNCFESAEVSYTEQLNTIVTPPVVELNGDEHIVVQGNTRALFAYKNGISELRCVVVRDSSKPLPSTQRVSLKDVLIGSRTLSVEDRYGGDIDKDYRNIEWATHHPDETLLGVKL